jgi:uncharacterized LabA/DUF88 family protein
MKRVVLLIDGGHLRAAAKNQGRKTTPDFIEKFAKNLPGSDEELQKILYYDCAPYVGEQSKPVSGEKEKLSGNSEWLDNLATRDLFAVRKGQLKFRGWVPKKIPVAGGKLEDAHFKPNFEQKGVDMRLGLDIAALSVDRSVERILLVSADTDMIPAMKQARKSGIQVVTFQLPHSRYRDKLRNDLKANSDFVRQATYPDEV